ncbi:MAG: 50S ribosomal protein L6 [Bifidobacteriaceae bacterium]|jgi:large subunit ribosomal protein L6|nr:50S ribosomal protein L6 [Bifidobacteriaceae bacterium]
MVSRIGKIPVDIPQGVELRIENNSIYVKGPKGELSENIPEGVKITINEGQATIVPFDDERQARSLHGLVRTLISNMVVGVQDGYQKTLEIIGTGYRVNLKGNSLEFALGFSHPVSVQAPEGITFAVGEDNQFTVSGISKQLVGEVSANIRKLRPPEPYKGKGIKYIDERIIRKAGKAGK